MDFNSKPIENTYSPKPPDIRYYNNAPSETCGKIENTNNIYFEIGLMHHIHLAYLLCLNHEIENVLI